MALAPEQSSKVWPKKVRNTIHTHCPQNCVQCDPLTSTTKVQPILRTARTNTQIGQTGRLLLRNFLNPPPQERRPRYPPQNHALHVYKTSRLASTKLCFAIPCKIVLYKACSDLTADEKRVTTASTAFEARAQRDFGHKWQLSGHRIWYVGPHSTGTQRHRCWRSVLHLGQRPLLGDRPEIGAKS